MEGMVTIMANVGFVWSSPGLMGVEVGGPVVGGPDHLQEDPISEFLFQVRSLQIESDGACIVLTTAAGLRETLAGTLCLLGVAGPSTVACATLQCKALPREARILQKKLCW